MGREGAETERAAKRPKLTAEQGRKVRSLIKDEGYTRAEAVAWVSVFEPAAPSVAPDLLAAAQAAEQLLASITSLPSDLADFQNTALRMLRDAIAKAMSP